MSETNRKSPRTFQCRDALWTKFEELARELECSVDYLINDAMKQYARQRGQTATASQTGMPVPPPPPQAPTLPGSPPSSRAPAPPAPRSVAPPLASAPTAPKAPPPPALSRGPAPPPMPGAPSTLPTVPGRVPPPPLGAPPLPPLGAPPLPPLGAVPPPPSSRAPAPPLPPASLPAMVPPAAPPTQARPLILHYDGEAFPVTKERFFIGRGKQSSDLTIRDPNVSRQHAVVEFVGGVFYMVDMGSTNGIEFAGQRVHRKAIQHGDVYKICDHQIVCSYQ